MSMPFETESRHPGAVPAGTSDLELLRTFEPVVCYTSGERFFPTSVEHYVNSSSLWSYNPDGTETEIIEEGALDIQQLTKHREYPFRTIEFLRLISDSGIGSSARVLEQARRLRRESGERFRPGTARLARGGLAPRVVDALFSLSFILRGNVPRVTAAAAELAYHSALRDDERYVYYGRVTRQAGWTVLQYWFFYYYNSWRSSFGGVNDHESDWENVLLYLYEKDGMLYPEWAAYASHDFHGGDLRRRWDDAEQLDIMDGHPLVWAGAGSHASHFQPGEYQSAIGVPLPSWVRTTLRTLDRSWNRFLGRDYQPHSALRIPFVDYARGDGKRIGPGQKHGWDPAIIDESTPWVGSYRGLWGLYARDPISGENAPAGPMYERDGTPRLSWYDPLGFAGLGSEAPPSIALEVVESDIADIEKTQERLTVSIGEKTERLQALGAKMNSMQGNPHLRSQHDDLAADIVALQTEISLRRRDLAGNEAILGALRIRSKRLSGGLKDDPRAHIKTLQRPVPASELRFGSIAGAWSAVSLSLMLLGVVALIVFARSHLWIGLLVMGGALILIDAILRGRYGRTVSNIAAVLATVTAVLVVIHYWFWILVAFLVGLAIFLLSQKFRELRR